MRAAGVVDDRLNGHNREVAAVMRATSCKDPAQLSAPQPDPPAAPDLHAASGWTELLAKAGR